MSFAAHTEQVHVERRNLIPVCLSAQQLFVRRRRPVWITVVDTVGCGHRMYPVGIDRHMIEKRLTCLHFVPLGIAGRQEPLVAPVQIDLRPVDVAGSFTQLLEKCDAGSTASQHDGRKPASLLGIDDGRDQACGGSVDKLAGVGKLLHDNITHRSPSPIRPELLRRSRPDRADAIPRRGNRVSLDDPEKPARQADRCGST